MEIARKIPNIWQERDTGKITLQKYNEIEEIHEIDWAISKLDHYFSLPLCIQSPAFSVGQSRWYLRINTDNKIDDSVRWVSLYLCRDDSEPGVVVCFSLGLRQKKSGTAEMIIEDITCMFPEKDYCYAEEKFMEKSKLLEMEHEREMFGRRLTVTCTLRMNEVGKFTSRLMNMSAILKKLFRSKAGCDATLKVQNEEFPVHRHFLASCSPVFETMFEADMKEKNTGVVDIVDCHPQVMRSFLEYVYTGKLKTSSDFFELYRIAHRYCVEGLKEECALLIARDISLDNVFDVAIFGKLFGERLLNLTSQKFFCRHARLILRTPKWSSLLREDPDLANTLLVNMTYEMVIRSKEGLYPDVRSSFPCSCNCEKSQTA